MAGKILVVHKQSRYERYSGSDNATLQEYARADPVLQESHAAHNKSLEHVLETLESFGLEKEVFSRDDLLNLNYGEINKQHYDLVVSVGGDGTFLDASHYVDNALMLGVNSDPKRSVGFYSCSTAETFADILTNISPDTNNAESIARTTINRLDLKIDEDLVPPPILNDVLIAHVNPAASSRYQMEFDGSRLPKARDSGILICTAAGSTAWMYQEGGFVMPIHSKVMQVRQRGSRDAGFYFAHDYICLESHTRQGQVYVDGENIIYPFTVGSQIMIAPGKPLTVIGDLEEKRYSS